LCLLTGCVSVSLDVPLDEPEHPCFPLRGEEQPFDIQARGQGYNSATHHCA